MLLACLHCALKGSRTVVLWIWQACVKPCMKSHMYGLASPHALATSASKSQPLEPARDGCPGLKHAL